MELAPSGGEHPTSRVGIPPDRRDQHGLAPHSWAITDTTTARTTCPPRRTVAAGTAGPRCASGWPESADALDGADAVTAELLLGDLDDAIPADRPAGGSS